MPAKLRTSSLGFPCSREHYPGRTFEAGGSDGAAFVHIPKNGGTTVERYLSHYNLGHDHRMVSMRRHYGQYDHRFATAHSPLTWRPLKHTQFTFAFVRNPYERLGSLYYYCPKSPLGSQSFPCKPYAEVMNFTAFTETILSRAVGLCGGKTLCSKVHPPDFQFGRIDPQNDPPYAVRGKEGMFSSQGEPLCGTWWGHCWGPSAQWVTDAGAPA